MPKHWINNLPTRLLLGLLFLVQVVCAQSVPPPTNFKFSDVDEKLLQEVNEYDRQLQKKGLVYDDPDLTAYLNDIAQRLLRDKPVPERAEIRVRAMRDPMINAFALPNGSIYVNTGLLAAVEDEAELASVIAHEITHVSNRHTYLHNRSTRKKSVTMHVFAAAASVGGYFPAGSVFGASLQLAGTLGEVMTVATIYGYSQDLERESDQNGLALLVNATYDPHAMPRAFERLDEKLEFEPVEPFWRTHPRLKERRQVTMKLADEHPVDKPMKTPKGEYLARVSSAMCYNIKADLRSRRARTALARAQRLASWNPEDPAYQVLMADAYLALGAKTAEPTPKELTDSGQSEDRKRYFKRTEDEEQKELLAKPGGPEERRKNRDKAEKLYLDTMGKNPACAEAHRGLGSLYESDGRAAEAAAEYRKYLELAPADAMDRLRIERRAQQLENAPPAPRP